MEALLLSFILSYFSFVPPQPFILLCSILFIQSQPFPSSILLLFTPSSSLSHIPPLYSMSPAHNLCLFIPHQSCFLYPINHLLSPSPPTFHLTTLSPLYSITFSSSFPTNPPFYPISILPYIPHYPSLLSHVPHLFHVPHISVYYPSPPLYSPSPLFIPHTPFCPQTFTPLSHITSSPLSHNTLPLHTPSALPPYFPLSLLFIPFILTLPFSVFNQASSLVFHFTPFNSSPSSSLSHAPSLLNVNHPPLYSPSLPYSPPPLLFIHHKPPFSPSLPPLYHTLPFPFIPHHLLSFISHHPSLYAIYSTLTLPFSLFNYRSSHLPFYFYTSSPSSSLFHVTHPSHLFITPVFYPP